MAESEKRFSGKVIPASVDMTFSETQVPSMPRWEIDFASAYVDTRDLELMELVAQVNALAGMIGEIPLPPALRQRLNALNIIRAVRGTTGIEGSDLTEEEVARVVSAGGRDVLPPSRRRLELEARNANRVMEFIRETLRANPTHTLTENDLLEMHRLTTEGIDYSDNIPGQYRTKQVSAGDYTAPEPKLVPDLIARFFEWFPETKDRDQWPECVRAVAAHFYLISIHPFGNGNGRTSRAVESFVLYRSGINSLGFFSLANFYYVHRDEYVDMLDNARWPGNGDMTKLVKFALRGLNDELRGIHQQALAELKRIAFRDYVREVFQADGTLQSKTGARRLQLVLTALKEPVSLASVRSRLHPLSGFYRGTTRTLSRDVNYLEELGLVTVRGGTVEANLDIMNQFTE